MTKIFRHFIICTVLLLTSGIVATNAKETDSIPKQKYDSIIKLTDSLRKTDSAKNAALKLKESGTNSHQDSASTCDCVPYAKDEVKPEGFLLAILPALLFIWLLIWLMNKGLKDFSLKEAMSENAYPTIIVDNPEYKIANLASLTSKENLEEVVPPTIEKTYLISTPVTSTLGGVTTTTTTYLPPPPNPSISRYIAFITSILTLVVALGVSCFYIYHYVRRGCPPELSGISTLLIALGIGVLPYVFNKVAGAVGKSKDDSN